MKSTEYSREATYEFYLKAYQNGSASSL